MWPSTAASVREDVTRLYREGASIRELATRLGIQPRSVRANLRNWGTQIRPQVWHRKHQLNEQYFDEIDTEEKAYWLGFLFADGCVKRCGNSHYVTLGLALLDKAQVERFREALSCETPVAMTTRPNGYSAATLTIGSIRLASALIKHGCVPRKSYGHPLPMIPDFLKGAFFRGYFDGDGSLSCTAKGIWRFAVAGQLNLLKSFQDWLISREAAGRTSTGLAGSSSVCSVLQYSGRRQITRIMRALYDGSRVHLPRKFETFQRLLVTS